MDPQSVNRAIMSTGLWVGVAFTLGMVTGADLPMFELAQDGAIMGASALGSDLAHGWAGILPSAMSSAASTGLMYAAIQRAWRGDDSYVVNWCAAAGNDLITEVISTRLA